MAPRMPRVLHLGGRTVRVTRDRHKLRQRNEPADLGFGTPPFECEMDPGRRQYKVLGRYYPWARRIVVHPDLPRDEARLVLYHEALHMAWDEAGLTEVPKLNEFEEVAVTALSLRLLEMHRRNPTFNRYIAAPE